MAHRVLCIESDAGLRSRVRALLEAEGLAVDEAASGLAGLERARTLPPDLVLANVHLPDIEGTELAARLRQDEALQRVPFLAVGHGPEEREVALAAGFDGFLERETPDEQLRGEVRAILGGKRERLPEAGERAGLRALSASMASRLEHAITDATRAERLLAERNRLGSVFMLNLAHDLATPLTPMSGYLKILASEKTGPLTPQQRRVIEVLQASAERLHRVVDNLADFASLQAGESPIVPGRVDPDALVDEVVADQRSAVRDARVHVLVSKGGGGPVSADPRKLRQALSNLVQNAVKFSPHGGEVLVEVKRDPSHLRFAVYDQGPGVSPADAENIFEPFFHATTGDDSARPPGSGLGLPVARRIAEAHGGRVWLESPPRTQPGSAPRLYTGSKFVLEIPLRAAEADAARVSG